MDIILRTDVENLGKLGDMVSVKPGYARNYLIPYGMAMMATEANKTRFEQERDALQAKVDALRAEANNRSQQLDGLTVTIEVRVGESDKLYGSVTAANISEALAAMDIDLDRRKILLEAPIRALGIYPVEVKLYGDARPTLEVAVVKTGQTAEDMKDLLAAEEAGEQPQTEETMEAAAPETQETAPETEAQAPEAAGEETAEDEAR